MKFLSYLFVFMLILSCSEEQLTPEGPVITLPDGFEARLLYTPSNHEQGSWVSITNDNKGRLITSDQYGSLYRVTVPTDGGNVLVEEIPVEIGSAQGLLWAFDGLYVSVNSREDSVTMGSGVYKITDTTGDDQLDQVELLISLNGNGEHGPHALILGPEGKQIYLIAGNHTTLPENYTSVLKNTWQEDRLFQAVLDPRGHANDITAPGGWIARSDSKGESWEVIASGFRNSYDIAFNEYGDLFTFDSDMEWDLGTPWYRPIRVCHVIPGSEFGWRTGSGKWAPYYPDNLPGILNVGQGSPTGIVFGEGAKFPADFQKSLFVSDWSFGTIYQVELTREGGSYAAEKTEFLSGTPLPITDLVISKDGMMYFTTGGRRGVSHLYQVRYTGSESVESKPSETKLNVEQEARRALAVSGLDVEEIWQYLSHEDRFVRYAARIALEKHPVDSWKQQLLDETNTVTKIQASLAAVRSGHIHGILGILLSIDPDDLALDQQLDLVRAYALTFIRSQNHLEEMRLALPSYPSGNPALDRELCELMVYLNMKEVIKTTLDLMDKSESSIEADLIPEDVLERSEQYGPTVKAMYENRPVEQSLALALSLSNMEFGWTPEDRKRYFTWFYQALQKSGGMSYTGFVEQIRLRALSHVPDLEKLILAEISGESLLQNPGFDKNIPPPVGPGRIWQISEANKVVSNRMENRSFERGEELYQSLLCASCHTMNGKGGNVGPDLTQAGTRFSNYDLLNSMILPSVSISDQYGATLYRMKDGSTLIGRALRTTNDTIFVNTNPFTRDSKAIGVSDIASQEPSPVSLMPAGLINSLNEDELADFMAYLVSGGDANHKAFVDQ